MNIKKKLVRLSLILCFCATLSLASAEVLFSDTFGGITGRPGGYSFDTPDRNFWFVRDGWLYTGNGDDLISADGLSFALINNSETFGGGDARVSCRFWMSQANGSVVLVGRHRDRRNYTRAELVVRGPSVALRLVSLLNGNETVVDSQVLDLKALGIPEIAQGDGSRTYEFALAFDGGMVSGWLNGQRLAQGRDPNARRGSMGVGQRMNEVYFNNIIVTTVGAEDIAGIDTLYHVQMGSGLAIGAAEALAKQLNDAGNGPAFVRGGEGNFLVLQGNYPTREAAEQGRQKLQAANANPGEIVAEKFGAAAAPAQPESGTAYRVQLAAAKDLADARGLIGALRQQGYFPAMVQDGEYHKVFVGRFATMDDATRMRARMVAEGFTFAKVVLESDLGTPPPAPTAEESRPRALPSTVLESDAWKNLTQAEKEEVARLVAMQRASRAELQSMQEIMELKKAVGELGEGQKKIIMTISETEERDEKRQRDIRGLITRIDRAKDAQEYDEALALLEELDKLDPASPIPSLKREAILHLKHGTFPGSDALKERERNEINTLMARAGQLANATTIGELEQALNLYTSVMAKNPEDESVRARATQQVTALSESIKKMRAQEAEKALSESRRREYIFWAALGGVLVVFILAILVLYAAGRRRYARMLRQMQDEAIAPLQELRERTQMLAAGGAVGAPGLHFNQPDRNLISRAETSSSEFMIAEDEETETPPAKPTPPPTPRRPSPTPKAVATAPVQESSQDDDDFMMDFTNSQSSSNAKSNAPSAPQSQAEPVEETESEELVFSFDDEPVQKPNPETTNPAITAAEVLSEKSSTGADDIVFSFDDEPLPNKTAVPALSKSEESLPMEELDFSFDNEPKTKPAEDSLYESIPLGDLSLDTDADQTIGSLEADSPFADSLDLDETSDEDTLVKAGVGDSSAGAAFTQDFSENPVGSMPQGWNGANTPYAQLSVVADPDGHGNCMLFQKTVGDGPTSYSRAFPDITGKVRVEFDIRCDEKNKHLLGFYVEKDGDFRRSVHTVVQCVDPSSPAHLRVFTRPMPYQLGEWRHVKYIIDLVDGMVDGYVNDQLVAEGVRMGTRTDSLNTLSIRDNSETTGTLYIRDIVVAPAEE